MDATLDIFAPKNGQPMWLGTAETVQKALVLMVREGKGSYFMFSQTDGQKQFYEVGSNGTAEHVLSAERRSTHYTQSVNVRQVISRSKVILAESLMVELSRAKKKGTRFLHRQPIPSLMAEFLCPLHATNTSSQIGLSNPVSAPRRRVVELRQALR